MTAHRVIANSLNTKLEYKDTIANFSNYDTFSTGFSKTFFHCYYFKQICISTF